ncbi:Transcription factor iws1 [Claviceps sp. LM77 group G4]|nr:Transcription factor iws1 [Claviceps sp. LM77 group G4]KAG6076748.1 Transcription factor iws1 [Claviceps sp. LM78 group G4]KAG6083888.1 Transcription factor iws1 [Claviceps sp. LM84 group G4]
MSDHESPVGSPENAANEEDQAKEFQDELAAADSDRESDALSEIDENEFEDYDPETAKIEDRPVDIDEDIARTLKASKRKRTTGDAPKKPREGRREKKRRDDDEDIVMDDGAEEADGNSKRRSRRPADGERRRATKSDASAPEKEEDLSPEERRKRAIDRALDAAIKRPGKGKRRRKDEIDLEDEIDDQLAELKVRMEKACRADNEARESGNPAVHKLKLLPDVNAILNRNNVQHAVLDPDINFLQHVKFFLEPLNDGSLPAYNIQRDLFIALTKLNVEKETLLSSGVGKVVLFYTRSKKPEPSIKRMAERLLGEWSRPVLKRTDDYKKRHVESREYDYKAARLAQRQKIGAQFNLSQRPTLSAKDAERERILAPVGSNNRARMANLPESYTIAPRSTFEGAQGTDHRPLGAGGMEAFRRMTTKNKKRG